MRVFSKNLLSASGGNLNLVYDTPGTYTFFLPSSVYANIAIVGAGQPCERHKSTAAGTSPWCYTGNGGSAFVGKVILPKGYYTVVVGNAWNTGYQVETQSDWTTYADWAYAEDSILSNDSGVLINAGASKYADLASLGMKIRSNPVLTISENLRVSSTIIASNGNMGATSSDIYNPIRTTGYAGGASLYKGYGKGSDSMAYNYTKGYFSIQC